MCKQTPAAAQEWAQGWGGASDYLQKSITLSGLQPGPQQKVETAPSCSASLINLVFQTQ